MTARATYWTLAGSTHPLNAIYLWPASPSCHSVLLSVRPSVCLSISLSLSSLCLPPSLVPIGPKEPAGGLHHSSAPKLGHQPHRPLQGRRRQGAAAAATGGGGGGGEIEICRMEAEPQRAEAVGGEVHVQPARVGAHLLGSVRVTCRVTAE